jgi:hypothetical protein
MEVSLLDLNRDHEDDVGKTVIEGQRIWEKVQSRINAHRARDTHEQLDDLEIEMDAAEFDAVREAAPIGFESTR